MSAALEFREVPAKKGFEKYGPTSQVVIDEVPVIDLLPGDEENTYTLAWSGRIAFADLEQKVLRELPGRISLGAPKIDISSRNPRGSVVASLMLNNHIVELELTEQESHFAASKALEELEDPILGMVKLDVNWHRGGSRPMFSYAFTSENRPVTEDNNELAVRLPSYMPVNPALVEWIFESQSNVPNLDAGEIHTIASTLSGLRSHQTRQ